tara:strand:+ start:4052 stop:5194 length:1143 start_codon:yes stop_codon:yes gene_type:complete
MKTALTLAILTLFVVSIVPGVLAVSVGTGVNPDIGTEDFEPRVWMCDHRVVYDDATEPWRVSSDGATLVERFNNYAFEGEQIGWKVLVFDKNGIEKISDVFATIGSSQGAGNDIEVNCQLNHIVQPQERLHPRCNARIDEEHLYNIPENTGAYYDCLLTVETPDSMYGEFWITVEAEDLDGLSGTMDENEYWFLNPVVALSIDGDLTFDDVRPGTDSYSSTLLVENDADDGSGVSLDMFISGTDFYDSASSGAKCPVTNQLGLENFRYFATSGAYSTLSDAGTGRASGNGAPQVGPTAGRDKDVEGYVDIGYGIGFHDPHPFYDGYEIIQTGGPVVSEVGYKANVLTPGAEMAVTFKLSLPEPCNGDFDTGSIFFWGEAI